MEGRFNGGFFALRVWWGLYMEGLIFGILDFTLWTPHFSYWFPDCVFSHDVMAAIFVSQNNETAAMFVSQTSPVGVELFFYVKAFFCSHECA